MEFHAKAPANLISSGERGKLLDSFCAFQTKLNKPSDTEAEHWDMALLLSGLDFYAVENGKNNYVTMGMSSLKNFIFQKANYDNDLVYDSQKVCPLLLECVLIFTTV